MNLFSLNLRYGIIRRLVPKGADLGACGSRLPNLIVIAAARWARVGPKDAGLDDRLCLAKVLAVADVVIGRAAVGGEGQPVAVLRALGHECRVLGLRLDAAEVDFFVEIASRPHRGGPDSGACDTCAGEEKC